MTDADIRYYNELYQQLLRRATPFATEADSHLLITGFSELVAFDKKREKALLEPDDYLVIERIDNLIQQALQIYSQLGEYKYFQRELSDLTLKLPSAHSALEIGKILEKAHGLIFPSPKFGVLDIELEALTADYENRWLELDSEGYVVTLPEYDPPTGRRLGRLRKPENPSQSSDQP
jgi:hypothetical protein